VLPNGRVITLNNWSNAKFRLVPVGSGWGLGGQEIGEPVTGHRAAYTFRSVLTSRNYRGGQQEDVDNAVSLLAEVSDPGRFISRVARVSQREQVHPLPAHISFALEMALHEDVERRALEGELAELRSEWAMAEEIAAIADNMMLPATVDDSLQRLRQQR
jgi:hypothetical protein